MKIDDAIRNVVRVFMNFPDIASEEDIESFGIAIEAMNKQDPMKLEIDGEFDLLCAGCGSVIDFKGHDGDYCPYCGQRIDWSGE